MYTTTLRAELSYSSKEEKEREITYPGLVHFISSVACIDGFKSHF